MPRRKAQRTATPAPEQHTLAPASNGSVLGAPSDTPQDYAALALAQRVARAEQCTLEAMQALKPILDKHRCRLVVRQTFTDGVGGPIEILCATLD